MKKIVKYFLISILIGSSCYADPIKIQMIERISQFIQWPIQIENYFIIGVYKNPKITLLMQESYKDKLINNLPIKIINIDSFNDVKNNSINLIYFTQELNKDLELFLKEFKTEPILVITDYPDDIYNEHIHLALYFSEQKIKFSVNQTALDNTNLKASYQLLKLAKIVKSN